MNFEWPIGSTVRVTHSTLDGDVEHIGIALESADDGLEILKLANGYNVPILHGRISNIQVVSGPSTSSSEDGNEASLLSASDRKDSDLPLVTVIHTGGTIASSVDYSTGAVVAKYEPEALIETVPRLAEIANIEAVKLGNMWSDDVRPQHWNRILEATRQAFESGSVGVVIGHGTDTMHITAAALNFGWAGTGGRPPGRIVVTGSQRSSDRGSTDAVENLIGAVAWAANGPEPSGEADACVIVMHAGSSDGILAVHSGVSTRKMHSSARDAFEAINRQPLAKIEVLRDSVEFHIPSPPAKNARPIHSIPELFDPSIRIRQVIAGPWLRASDLGDPSTFDAVVVHGTGLGHIPIEDPEGDAPENIELESAFSSIISMDIPVIMTTQCIRGPVDLHVYSKGRHQQGMGIKPALDATSPDVIGVKAAYLLGRGLRGANFSEAMSSNLSGERSATLVRGLKEWTS